MTIDGVETTSQGGDRLFDRRFDEAPQLAFRKAAFRIRFARVRLQVSDYRLDDPREGTCENRNDDNSKNLLGHISSWNCFRAIDQLLNEHPPAILSDQY